jgi:hypothetical protein
MNFYWLVVGTLVVWRFTHLLQAEDGPWDIMVRFRTLAGTGFGGNFLDCFYCLSLWIALPVALLVGEAWIEKLLLWPALSAGAILLERITTREEDVPPATYFEDGDKKEEDDGMLRKTKETAQRTGTDLSTK